MVYYDVPLYALVHMMVAFAGFLTHVELCLQIAFLAFTSATLFIRPRMPTNTVSDGSKFAALLFFSLVTMLFDGFTEVSRLLTGAFSSMCAFSCLLCLPVMQSAIAVLKLLSVSLV